MPRLAPPSSPARPEASRDAILRAAVTEFGERGEAGARTDSIARAAGVNKALLHYYYGTKEGLYGAVLDAVFGRLATEFTRVLEGPGTPGERLLRYFLAHFSHLAQTSSYGRLLGHEMMRVRTGQPSRIPQIVKLCFAPLHAALHATLEAGMADGELRSQEPGLAILSMIGSNVFYFTSAPFFKEITGKDPRDPDLLARQRSFLLELAATVLFADPVQGRILAQRILHEPPAPRAAAEGPLP